MERKEKKIYGHVDGNTKKSTAKINSLASLWI